MKHQHAHAKKSGSLIAGVMQDPKRKKIFIICLVLFLAAAAGLSFSLFRSCGKSGKQSGQSGSSKGTLITNATQIAGSWTPDSTTYYDFGSDGKGTMYTSMNTYTFTYTINKNAFHIDFSDESAKDCDYYCYRNGDKLTFVDKNSQQTYELRREKKK